VGDDVSWRLRDLDSKWLQVMLGDDLTRGIEKAEEHHGGVSDDVVATVGVVVSIQAVHCRYAPLPGRAENDLFPVAGSGTVTLTQRADGWTPNVGDLRFVGYVVGLTPAQEHQST
jgi:hypothetical protein